MSTTTAKETNTTHGDPWRPQQMIEGNPVGLDQEVTEQLIPTLDEIQCTLWTLYHQYQKHHWLVEGPQFRDLHHLLEENYEEIHADIDMIAERITALGGIPTSAPDAQAELSHVTHEPEGTYRIRQMLQHDIDAERILAEFLRETIAQAQELGDPGTEHELKEVLTRAEDRAHHLDHLLGEDSLEINRPDGNTA